MLDRKNTCVLIFNMQTDMIPLLENSVQILHNNIWLIDFSSDLEIPVIVFKHKKLGEFPKRLQDVSENARFFEKEFFDCTSQQEIREYINALEIENVVLAGAETHVCIYQSAIGLQNIGKKAYILVDSVSSRNISDHKIALHRFDCAGMEIISQEMFFFETVRNSERSEYHNLAMKFLDGRYIG